MSCLLQLLPATVINHAFPRWWQKLFISRSFIIIVSDILLLSSLVFSMNNFKYRTNCSHLKKYFKLGQAYWITVPFPSFYLFSLYKFSPFRTNLRITNNFRAVIKLIFQFLWYQNAYIIYGNIKNPAFQELFYCNRVSYWSCVIWGHWDDLRYIPKYLQQTAFKYVKQKSKNLILSFLFSFELNIKFRKEEKWDFKTIYSI